LLPRCPPLGSSFNIAAANSSGYNYASGRLDHQTYYKAIRVEQSHLECVVLDRILAVRFEEEVLLPDFFLRALHQSLDSSEFKDGVQVVGHIPEPSQKYSVFVLQTPRHAAFRDARSLAQFQLGWTGQQLRRAS
jgi:hypothetical protein